VTTFKAIADKVNTEVEKVAFGGTPLEAQLKDIKGNLNASNSPAQIAGVAKAYARLMATRVNMIDDDSVYYAGTHVHMPQEATEIFNKLGSPVNAQSGRTLTGQPMGKTSAQVKSPNVVPQGKLEARNQKGELVGYADDDKGTNLVRF